MDMYENYPEGGTHQGETEVRSFSAAVPVDRFNLYIKVAPELPSGWQTGIRVTGTDTDPPRVLGPGVVMLAVQAGKPESIMQVQLPSLTPDGIAEVYQLRRTEKPRVVMEVKVDGGWKVGTADGLYPSGSLTVRLRFTRPMNRASVETRMQPQNGHHPHRTDRPLEGAYLEWVDDQTLLVRADHAPPTVAWSLFGAQDQEGLYLTGAVPALHFGDPPYLSAVDPFTNRERRLGALPPEPRTGQLSLDGTKLLLTAAHWETGARGIRSRYWRVDVASGERTVVEVDRPWEYHLFLAPDGTVRTLPSRDLGRSTTLSPDRAHLAVLRSDQLGRVQSPVFLYPHDLVILSPDGKERQTVAGFTQLFAPPKDFRIGGHLAWSPDGRQIATAADGSEGGTLLVADLNDGKVRKIANLPKNLQHPSTLSLDYSGRHFLIAGTLYDNAGNILRELPQGRFNPAGTHVLFSRANPDPTHPPWGEIGIAQVETGETQTLGSGLPIGWLPTGEALVIRWTNWQHRLVQFSSL
jgi:hypothetical protein